MTFNELIQKMKEENKIIHKGVSKIIENSLAEMNEDDKIFDEYNFLQGILWGLHATEFITDYERSQLSCQLNEKIEAWAKKDD